MSQGVEIHWLGTAQGMENKLLASSQVMIHPISVTGLRGMGIMRKLFSPIMVGIAVIQAMRIIARVKPGCVLGMGGFVSGPGGIAAKLLGKPLLIHEQNAVAGATNRILAKFANRIFEAFPNTFPEASKVVHSGNPVRAEIVALHKRQNRSVERVAEDAVVELTPLRILVLGGSQGAGALNAVIPEVLAQWPGALGPQVLHQTGEKTLAETKRRYQSLGLDSSEQYDVRAFIEDMATAYAGADIVICRSGASTVSEIAVVGLASILVPYPHHSDQQQTLNARWLSDCGAAHLLQQTELNCESLGALLQELDANREQLNAMGERAESLAICNANDVIAAQCLEFSHVQS